MDFSFFIKKILKTKKLGIFKIVFCSLGFYRLLQRQSLNMGF